MPRTLSALAQASINAQQTDEVWLVRLAIKHASIPGGLLRFVNDMQNLVVIPPQKLSAPLLDNWTNANSTDTALKGNEVIVTDSDTGAQGEINNLATALSTANATFTIRVRKDATPKTTRYCVAQMDSGGGNISGLYLDTSTGEILAQNAGTGHVASGVLDEGDAWILYLTRSGVTSYTARFFPAFGASATLGAGNATSVVGSARVSDPAVYQGTISNRVVWIAFPFQLDLPTEDPDVPSVASLRIDNVDQQIVEAVRDLPSAPTCDMEVVLASQPSTVEVGFYDLTIRAADFDALYVEAQMTYEAIFSEPLSLEMTPARFPGMF